MTLTEAVSSECWVKNKIGGKVLEITHGNNFLKRVIAKKTKMEQMFERNMEPKILGLFLHTVLVVRNRSMMQKEGIS